MTVQHFHLYTCLAINIYNYKVNLGYSLSLGSVKRAQIHLYCSAYGEHCMNTFNIRYVDGYKLNFHAQRVCNKTSLQLSNIPKIQKMNLMPKMSFSAREKC